MTLRLLGLVMLFSGGAAAYDSSREPAEPMPRASESMLLDLTTSGGRLVAVGERGHVLLSDDGKSWRQAAVVPTRSTLTAVTAVGDRLWAVGHDRVIIASTDGGENWVLQHASPDIDNPEVTRPLMDVFFVDQQTGFALGAYALFLGTADGGATWTPIDLTAGAADDEYALTDEDEYYEDHEAGDDAGDGDDYEYQTYDDFTDDFVDYHLNAMTRLADGSLYIAAERGNGFISRDDGRTWEGIQLPYDGSMFGVLAVPGGALLTFGMRGHVFESADGGRSWTQVETGTLNTLLGGTVTTDGSVVIVGANGETLLRAPGAAAFISRPKSQGGDLAAVAALGDGLVTVGEDGVERRRIEGIGG